MQRHLPKLIRLFVDHGDPKAFSLMIDGEEFPYLLAEDAISVEVGPDELPSVQVTLMADRVEVVNDWTTIDNVIETAN